MLPRAKGRCWFWNSVDGLKYHAGDLALTACILLNFWRKKTQKFTPLVDRAVKELHLCFVFKLVYFSNAISSANM